MVLSDSVPRMCMYTIPDDRRLSEKYMNKKMLLKKFVIKIHIKIYKENCNSNNEKMSIPKRKIEENPLQHFNSFAFNTNK